MNVELNVNELIKAREALNLFMQEKLPVKLAYKIKKIYKEVDEELKILEESKDKLLDNYAEKDENGDLKNEDGFFTIPKMYREHFEKELNELNNMKIKISFTPIKEEEIENMEITPSTLLALEHFIQFKEEEPTEKR